MGNIVPQTAARQTWAVRTADLPAETAWLVDHTDNVLYLDSGMELHEIVGYTAAAVETATQNLDVRRRATLRVVR